MKKLLILLFCLFTTNCFAQSTISDVSKVAGKEIYKASIGGDADNVVIGDEKNPATFKNQITFKEWKDNQGNFENTLSIIPSADLIASSTPTLSAGKIELKDSKIGWYANPDPNNPNNFKFGLILYSKPLTNTWSFQLEGWEEFDFFYQPPLANVNPDGSTWEDTPLGKATSPVEVSGSWAVYHKTKKDYIIGVTPNYQTGKFCHIYNILLTDADGKTIRVIPDIKNDIYTVTFPQDFLDNAKYPVKANDTFGYTSKGGYNTSTFNSVILSKFITTGAGTLSKLSCFCQRSSGTPVGTCGIYADSGDTPTSKLDNGVEFSVPVSSTNPVDSTGFTYGISNSTNYWLAFIFTEAATIYYDTSTGHTGYELEGGYSSTLPSSITSFQDSGAIRISIYATYTPSGGATGTVINNAVINNAVIQ